MREEDVRMSWRLQLGERESIALLDHNREDGAFEVSVV